MIYGVGTDILEISRMERILADERRAARIFSEAERLYIAGKGESAAQTAAGIFCAKEAVSKSLFCGMRARFWENVEVSHSESGAPTARIYGKLLAAAPEGIEIKISIAHEKSMAAAFAVSYHSTSRK